MKLTLSTKVLRETLKKLKGIGYKHTLPVLAHAHVGCADDKTIITVSDLERIIKAELPRDPDDNFAFLLPRREASQFLQGGDGEVVIEPKGPDSVELSREGMGKVAFYDTGKASDFPPMKYPVQALQWRTLDAKYLCRVLSFVAVACLQKFENRPALECVLFKDGEIVAADGFRLVVLNDKRLDFGLGNEQVLVHRVDIDLLLRLFCKERAITVAFEPDSEDNAKLTHVYFKAGNTTLISTIVQASFPNYKMLIPKSFASKVSFSAPLMEQRLKMIRWGKDGKGITRLVFGKGLRGADECQIKAGQEELCEYSLRCPVKVEGGEGSKIAFNSQYALDALNPFSMCNLELNGLAQPGMFTGDVEGLRILVMPMFVQW